jgi:GTPase SAR1 family protein
MSEIPRAKITMLGTTSAGKTCYMLGMYARMQMGVEGFTLRSIDLEQELELTDRWDKLVMEHGKDRWPPPNEGNTENYVFEFSYGFKPLLQFEWLDYRGGALRARPDERDQKILQAHLMESETLVLCVSGEHLTEKVDDATLNVKARNANINAMNWFLTELSKQRELSRERPFPVVILITKYDMCAHRPARELIADIKKMFNVLFSEDSNAGWLVMICPVTLGKDLAQDSENASIDPRSVHLPLIFAVYAHYQVPYMEWLAHEQQLSERVAVQQKKPGWRRWWDGDDMKKAMDVLSLTTAQRQEFEQKMRRAASELRDVDLFLGGERVEIDV